MPARRHRVVITHVRPAANTGAATRRSDRPSAAPVFIHPTGVRAATKVVLIHDRPASSLIWAHLEPALLARGVSVQVIDCAQALGQGVRPLDGFDHLDQAAAVARMLEEQPCPPMVIVGYGFGAGAALALAATAPATARALILVAPLLRPPAIPLSGRVLAAPVIGPAVVWLAFRGAGLALHLPPLRRRLLTERAGLTTIQSARVVRSFSRGHSWRRFTTDQRHIVSDAKRLHQLLGQVGCPALVIAGRNDHLAPFADVSALAAQLPGALLVPTDSGHLIPVDDPETVLDAVLRACELRPETDSQTQRWN